MAFLAVLSALLAPVSLLAEEVRTGKLGGLCSAKALFDGAGSSSDGSSATGGHCDLCGALGLVPPPAVLVSSLVPADASLPAIAANLHAGSTYGLRQGRGPPAL